MVHFGNLLRSARSEFAHNFAHYGKISAYSSKNYFQNIYWTEIKISEMRNQFDSVKKNTIFIYCTYRLNAYNMCVLCTPYCILETICVHLFLQTDWKTVLLSDLKMKKNNSPERKSRKKENKIDSKWTAYKKREVWKRES